MSGRAGEYIRGNLLGMVAIFIALGGVAWGASNKPKPQIAPKNSVVSKSIKDGQVKGSDVKESSLGTVPSAASLTGPLTTSGLLRVGSETGNASPPDLAVDGTYDGIVIRRLASTDDDDGQVLARTDRMSLVRDGSPGGLKVTTGATNDRILTAACTGVSANGAPISTTAELFHAETLSASLVSNASNPVMLDCNFGLAFNNGNTTEVHLLRRDGDPFYVGYLISTVNQ